MKVSSMGKWNKFLYGGATAIIIALVVWSLQPKAIPAEIGKVTKGDFEQTIIEDGMTRIKNRYVVSAPVDGVLPRVEWNEGDSVKKGQHLVTIKWDYDRAVNSPASGKILRILSRDTGFINKGKPILEIGNPRSLEIVVDVLTSNSVLIHPGDEVRIENWGGTFPLQGKVKTIEPSAFTKISALGVEEQRVNAIVELISPEQDWATLGDRFRVECHIVYNHLSDQLLVPTAAVFQQQSEWATFKLVKGKAVRTAISLKERGPVHSVVESGLSEGDKIILYPGDRIREGVKIEAR